MPRSETFPAEGVRRLYELTRRVTSSADLAEVLEEIAQGVVDGLGYGVAAISRLEGDVLVMAAVAGNDEVREEIVGRRTPAEQVLGREFSIADHWGILRFVPHDRQPEDQIESLWVPDIEAGAEPDAWHPLDALYAPLYSADGVLLGNMAVDLPPDNKVPDQQQRDLLEMFVVQAGLALENAQRREQLSRQVMLGEALRRLTTAGAHGDLDTALRAAVLGLTEAMDAAQVSVRCFGDTAHDQADLAAGFPRAAGVPGELARLLRRDLTQWVEGGELRPRLVTVDGQHPGFEASGLALVRHLRDHGWAAALVTPIALSQELLGYLVVMTIKPGVPFHPEEIEAANEAGRELGRLVRDARLRRTERRLVAELRELDRYKGELIATISHELKTPLTSIIGHTELLEEAGVHPSSVAAIGRNAARLDRLVTNLLNYSRIQGRQQLDRGKVDLAELCRGTLDMLAFQSRTAGVAMALEVPTEQVIVWGDGEELPRVIDNLCSNAVKYTPRGGQVRVSVRARQGMGEVVVCDTGLGISQQDQVHLFSAFHRSTNPEALTIPGTGLGLAISRTIAELHGGDITVESELGEGSTFTLRIPLVE
ncbi:ATP-binding protein [Nocardioides coralli]|uniref:ATP-binding protein n=1 Tax=Nocardioides coralli TaxID=2872154 RepID=UPI001CA44FFA|nr:ATP-binding protein [Nocardioides coralli]QZY30397.1 GAF domain-containing protein [Nocardioides coralli]